MSFPDSKRQLAIALELSSGTEAEESGKAVQTQHSM